MCVRPIVVGYNKARNHFGEVVPCGFCIECRSRYRRGWAIRCLHEASLHEENMYVTLTHADGTFPHGWCRECGLTHDRDFPSLCVREHQLFMKRLRKFVAPRKVRSYGCGEYGEVNYRPHYHLLIFGYMPRELEELPQAGPFPLFRSRELEELWRYGMSAVGEVSFASAQYVAGYVMKKVARSYPEYATRDKKRWSVDSETGEAHEIVQEYSVMSRGGRTGRGLGFDWFTRYRAEVARHDNVVIDGQELMPPRYYDELLREQDAVKFELMRLRRKRKREKDGKVFSEEKRERMAREVILRKRQADLERSL